MNPISDPAVIDQLQDEILAVIQAWADRGISPSDAAQFLAATSHLMLCKFGCPMGQLIQLIVHQWESNDGQL